MDNICGAASQGLEHVSERLSQLRIIDAQQLGLSLRRIGQWAEYVENGPYSEFPAGPDGMLHR
jgi:hypothetical protein